MDPALFFKNNEKGELIGLICAHVDDYIHCGTEEFRKNVIGNLVKIFQMGKTESKSFTYVGYDINQDESGISISQNSYAAGLKTFDVKPERAKQTDDDLEPEEKSKLKEIAGKLAWLGRGTRHLTWIEIEKYSIEIRLLLPEHQCVLWVTECDQG